MRIILANLPSMIALVIVALYGLYWARREREELRAHQRDKQSK